MILKQLLEDTLYMHKWQAILSTMVNTSHTLFYGEREEADPQWGLQWIHDPIMQVSNCLDLSKDKVFLEGVWITQQTYSLLESYQSS